MKHEIEAIDRFLSSQSEQVVSDWLAETVAATGRTELANDAASARELLQAFHLGLREGGSTDSFDGRQWEGLKEAIQRVSSSRAAQGANAADTSAFLLALKRPLFAGLQRQLADDPRGAMDAVWALSAVVDRMAQHSMGIFQRSREAMIARQQEELLELSTPVIKLWDGILAVPMIGTLDSNRTQLVMEELLERIVDTGSAMAIIDITGVPTVDTLVAQHLLKTVTAIRLMGADCIISGVRPQIAQTIVHLGIDLQGIVTKATLADALALAMQRAGYSIGRSGG